MSNPKHSAETYRVFCIILIVAIAAILWGWHNSEENRLKLLNELNEAQDRIEELEHELCKMR